MTIKALIIDADGTIYDTWKLSYLIWHDVITKLVSGNFRNGEGCIDCASMFPNGARRGSRLDKRLRQWWGYPLFQNLHRFFPAHHDPEELKLLWNESQEEWLKTFGSIQLINGAQEAISWMEEKGIIRILLTNRNTEFFLRDFDSNPILQSFSVIQTRQNETLSKNKLEVPGSIHLESEKIKPEYGVLDQIIEFLARESIEPCEVALIGDSVADAETALLHGVSFIGVKTGALDTDELWQEVLALLPYNDFSNIIITASIADVPRILQELD